MNKKIRLSNFELLRIVAILFIVIMHAAGYIHHTSDDTNKMVLTIINAVGNMGVTLFILISGFFAIHFRWSGVLRLWLIMLSYSIGIALFKTAMGEPIRSIYQILTPVTSQTWWFMTCYIILYFLSPFINTLTDNLSKRQFGSLLAIMGFFFLISPTLLSHELTKDMHGKGLPNMITAYLIGRYLARFYIPNIIKQYVGRLWFLAVILLITLTLFDSNTYCRDNNLLIVLGAVCLFCWVQQHSFNSSVINRLATYVFPLYLVNYTILNKLSGQYVPLMNDVSVWPPFLLSLLETILLAVLIESLRRLLMDRPINWLCLKVESTLNRYFQDKSTD